AGSLGCVANVAPNSQPEICNALDDNCNGATDEMNPTPACTMQNPGAQFVTTWGCMGTCQIVACTTGHADINQTIDDGCECVTDAYQNQCGVAGSVSVPKGATVNMT